jgi:acetoin utilization deacetylase AcuC-like enzyme
MADSPTNIGSTSGLQTSRVRCYLHPLFGAHDPGPHPERPARYAAVREAVEASGAERLEAPEAPLEAVERVHDPAFVAWLREVCESGGGMLDPDTVVNPFSFDAALRGCGGAVAAVDDVLDGAAGASFVAGRPPGHHAERARAMGFCLLDQIAVAAAHARARGLARVAILDWDVHHGNGTQAIFWDDPDVLYVSLHQYGWGFFPGTGAASERGGPGAEGATVNLPLPVGAGSQDFLEAFHERALPAVRLTAEDFAVMTRELRALGAPHAQVLEGGYDLDALRECVGAVLAALAEG